MALELIKHWEGTVIEPREPLSSDADSIFVQLVDIGPDPEPDLVAELLLRRIDETERAWLLAESQSELGPAGLVFDFRVWKPAEGPEEYAEADIVFRKDRWTPEEIEEVQKEAARMEEALGWFFEGDPVGAPTECISPEALG